MHQAINSARPGGSIGFVGVPHGVELNGEFLFFAQKSLLGGPAPVRRFLPYLMELVLSRKINPGKVFDLTLPLKDVAEGYRAMDERRAIKTMLRCVAARHQSRRCGLDRRSRVEQGTGPASPGLVRDTTDVLFRDLWLRPDLAPLWNSARWRWTSLNMSISLDIWNQNKLSSLLQLSPSRPGSTCSGSS